MKKVAIVGVEGSGKTVMLAGLGELYSKPDEQGYFLSPKNFATASYVADKIARMRQGEWPTATTEDVLQGLDWSIRRKGEGAERPQDVCEVSCLDFAGEVYRAAFGIRAENAVGVFGGIRAESLSSEAESLKSYVQNADDVIVLINLRDIIVNGIRDKRVQESLWITKSILQYALESRSGRKEPRAALVLTQADSYADTIRACGGAKGVLEEYLRDVANNYGWLDVFAVSAVDKTSLDADGNLVPAADFQPTGLKPLVSWILDVNQFKAVEKTSSGTRDVYLLDVGDNKIATINQIREMTDWGLKDVQDVVAAVPARPVCLMRDVSFAEAQVALSSLRRVGCVACLMVSGQVPKAVSETRGGTAQTDMSRAQSPTAMEWLLIGLGIALVLALVGIVFYWLFQMPWWGWLMLVVALPIIVEITGSIVAEVKKK